MVLRRTSSRQKIREIWRRTEERWQMREGERERETSVRKEVRSGYWVPSETGGPDVQVGVLHWSPDQSFGLVTFFVTQTRQRLVHRTVATDFCLYFYVYFYWRFSGGTLRLRINWFLGLYRVPTSLREAFTGDFHNFDTKSLNNKVFCLSQYQNMYILLTVYGNDYDYYLSVLLV